MIKYTTSLQRAIEIKTMLDGVILEEDINKLREIGISLWVESFDNCREQGLVIKVSTIKLPTLNIAITVHRNGDSTRIFKYTKTSFPNNLPSEDSWGDDKCFDYNKNNEVVDYIKKLIFDYAEREVIAKKQTQAEPKVQSANKGYEVNQK